jgi:serine/threonine kinase 3
VGATTEFASRRRYHLSIVRGLQEYLHGVANVCHRDIKYGNVLLAEDAHVDLADFGVSVWLTQTIYWQKRLIGLPFWMAPEVIQESHYDGRADAWSLGIAMIEVAEGAPPHSNLNSLQTISIIHNKPAPTLADPDSWSPEMLHFDSICNTRMGSLPLQHFDNALFRTQLP